MPAGLACHALLPAWQAHGLGALAAMRRNREAAAAAEDLRVAAERRLRLRRLGRAPGLPLPRFRTAALRLLQHADALQVGHLRMVLYWARKGFACHV